MTDAFASVIDKVKRRISMILTICPNPSLDCTIELQTLNVGQMNRIENKITTYSGKAMNVALALSRLSCDCLATGFMFEENGRQFVHTLDREGIKNTFVWNKGSVRENYKIIDKRSMMTEINDKGEFVKADKQAELIDLVKNVSKNCSIAVMSGSLPQGVEDDYYAKLCKVIPKKVKKVVDITGDRLLLALNEGVYLAKPNLREFEEVTMKQYKTIGDMINGCYNLIDKGAENVLLSLGKRGAILTDGSKSYYCKSANVAVNSTVGAGDCMVAAACAMIEHGASKDEILRCAVAAGTAAVTTPGTNLFYRDKFEEIYDKLTVEEIM